MSNVPELLIKSNFPELLLMSYHFKCFRTYFLAQTISLNWQLYLEKLTYFSIGFLTQQLSHTRGTFSIELSMHIQNIRISNSWSNSKIFIQSLQVFIQSKQLSNSIQHQHKFHPTSTHSTHSTSTQMGTERGWHWTFHVDISSSDKAIARGC